MSFLGHSLFSGAFAVSFREGTFFFFRNRGGIGGRFKDRSLWKEFGTGSYKQSCLNNLRHFEDGLLHPF